MITYEMIVPFVLLAFGGLGVLYLKHMERQLERDLKRVEQTERPRR